MKHHDELTILLIRHAEAGVTSTMRWRVARATLSRRRAWWRHRSGLVEVESHGNLISLALHALEPKVNYDFWNAIPMPALYRIESHDGRGRVVSGPGI